MLSLIGLALGCYFVLIPTLVSDWYGLASFGRSLSYIQLGAAVFISVLPLLRSGVHELLGSYQGMYLGVAALLLSGACALVREDRRKREGHRQHARQRREAKRAAAAATAAARLLRRTK